MQTTTKPVIAVNRTKLKEQAHSECALCGSTGIVSLAQFRSEHDVICSCTHGGEYYVFELGILTRVPLERWELIAVIADEGAPPSAEVKNWISMGCFTSAQAIEEEIAAHKDDPRFQPGYYPGIKFVRFQTREVLLPMWMDWLK